MSNLELILDAAVVVALLVFAVAMEMWADRKFGPRRKR
jgi:hypothetical protein